MEIATTINSKKNKSMNFLFLNKNTSILTALFRR